MGLNIRIMENASPQSNFDLVKMRSVDGTLMTMVTSGERMKPTGPHTKDTATPANELEGTQTNQHHTFKSHHSPSEAGITQSRYDSQKVSVTDTKAQNKKFKHQNTEKNS